MTKILVVEDVKFWREWIVHALAESKALLTFAENGKLGVDKVRKGSDYTAIIMNIGLPIMNGYEATQKIRELGYTRPIIGYSGLYHLEAVRMAFRAGMSHYLIRTHYMEDLQGALHQLGIIDARDAPTLCKDLFFLFPFSQAKLHNLIYSA